MTDAANQALSGVKILDLTVMTAGPISTMMLGDLGADILKVEEIGSGDLSRQMGNIYVEGESANFLSQNRNKRSIRLDLKSDSGRGVFRRLVAGADVVLENFRPGTMSRLGVGYEDLKAVNPGIIFASISAFGQTGPYAHLPANDPIVQALSGLMAMTGPKDGAPVRVGHPYPDFGAAALMAFAICAALFHRERTGEGQQLDLSLLSGTIFSAIPRDGETLRLERAPERLGSGHPSFVPYRNFQGSDGEYFFVACFTEKFFRLLCQAIERPDFLEDPRFQTNVARCENRDALDGALMEVFATRPAAHWVELLGKNNVPSAAVQDLHVALRQDPQIKHNGTVITVDHPTAGPVEMQALPITFRGTPARYDRPAPRFGEHTQEILRENGFSDEEIAALLKEGGIAALG